MDVHSKIRITSPQKLLRLVPNLLGFRPEASMVVLGAEPPRGTIAVTLRYPLCDPAISAIATYNVGHAIKVLTSRNCSQAVAIGYGPNAAITPFIKLLREQASKHDIQLTELLRVEESRYWSYVCTDPVCCSPEGTPFDPTPDSSLAAVLPKGVPDVLANRESLATLVAPAEGPAVQAMRRALRKAKPRITELGRLARTSADQATRCHPIALTGIVVRDARGEDHRAALGTDPAPRAVIAAVANIATTLAALAAKGVSHRDIKPDNLFERDGRWLVGDFGLMAFPEKDFRTEHGRRLGPIHYMAPEMRQDADRAEPVPTDVWALRGSPESVETSVLVISPAGAVLLAPACRIGEACGLPAVLDAVDADVPHLAARPGAGHCPDESFSGRYLTV